MSQLYIPSFDEILAVSQSRGAASDAPHLWDGLVGAWTMQEGGGLTAFDVSGRGNHGTLQQADQKTKWTTSNRGRSLDFDGTDDYVDVGDVELSVANSGDAITLSAYVNPDSIGSTGFQNGQGILTKDDNDLAREWIWQFEGSDGLYFRTIGGNNGGTPNVWKTGEWQHAVVVWNVGTNIVTYRNGEEIDDTAETDTSPSTNQSVFIGRSISSQFNPYYNGQIDDVRIYDRALTVPEISETSSDPWAAYRLRRRVFAVVAAGGATVQLGQAVDTSSAFAVSPKRTLTLGQAIDTQSAFAATARRDLVVGQAVSAETARAVTAKRAVTLQQASETDTAFAATPLRTFTAGLASESDEALAAQALRTLALGRADETDTAPGATVVTGADIAVGQAVETDTALGTTVQRTVSVGQAVETDTAPAVKPLRTLTVGQALETVTAFAVTPERGLTVGIATETDTAFATGVLTTVTLGIATETDTAFSVTALGAGQIQVGLAVETDTAFGLTIIVTAQFVGPYRPRRPDLVSSYQPRRPDSGSDYRARRPDEEVQ